MKKRIMALVLVALLSAGVLAANPLLQLGVAAQVPFQFSSDMDDMGDQFTDFSNYRFGADVRLNLSFFQLDVQAMMGGSGDKGFIFDGIASANIVFFPSSAVNFSAGLGMSLGASIKDGGFYLLSDDGQLSDLGDIGAIVKNSPFVYRIGLNFNFGIGLGLSYFIPTKASIESPDFKNWAPQFDEGRLSLSVMMNLF